MYSGTQLVLTEPSLLIWRPYAMKRGVFGFFLSWRAMPKSCRKRGEGTFLIILPLRWWSPFLRKKPETSGHFSFLNVYFLKSESMNKFVGSGVELKHRVNILSPFLDRALPLFDTKFDCAATATTSSERERYEFGLKGVIWHKTSSQIIKIDLFSLPGNLG